MLRQILIQIKNDFLKSNFCEDAKTSFQICKQRQCVLLMGADIFDSSQEAV